MQIFDVQQKKENEIIFDWLSLTSKNDSPQGLLEFLGIDTMQHIPSACKGINGYQYGMMLYNIRICFGGNNDTTFICMSGAGCRDFEKISSKSWYQVISDILEINKTEQVYNVTRIDVAYDDFIGLLDIQLIKKSVEQFEYCSRFRQTPIIFEPISGGLTVSLGSRSSETYFRIYDKAIEQEMPIGTHWIRWEMELKGSNAFNFLLQLQAENYELGKVFSGVCLNYIRFVIPNENNEQKCRWKTAVWYDKFIGDVNKISIWSGREQEYTILNLINYVQNYAGNAIDALIRIYGIEGLNDIVKKRFIQKNMKYEDIIKQEKSRMDFVKWFLNDERVDIIC